VKRFYRLTRSQDYQRVRRSGKSYAHPLVVLIYTPNELSNSRIGVSASHSVGNAVNRNKAKRRIKAVMDLLLPRINSGFDIVLLARRPILEADFQLLQAAITQLLTRSGLLDEIDGF
jgi:ribonuclease P protein component